MVKANIVRRSVDVPAPYLPAGTFFRYKNETRHIVETYPDCPLVRWSYAVEDGEAFILLVGKGW